VRSPRRGSSPRPDGAPTRDARPRRSRRASPGLVAGRALGLGEVPNRVAEGGFMHLRGAAPLVCLVPSRIEQAQRFIRAGTGGRLAWDGRGKPVSARAREVRLAPESIEALALRLSELLGPPEEPVPAVEGERRMLTAAEVSRLWGVSRRWVYENARALGVRRLGDGPRPRLRFDPEEVAASGTGGSPITSTEAAERWPAGAATPPARRRRRCFGAPSSVVAVGAGDHLRRPERGGGR
jgi:hypothetical protein